MQDRIVQYLGGAHVATGTEWGHGPPRWFHFIQEGRAGLGAGVAVGLWPMLSLSLRFCAWQVGAGLNIDPRTWRR